jgi:Glycosyltransferase family 87
MAGGAVAERPLDHRGLTPARRLPRVFWACSWVFVLIASGWIAWHSSSQWDYNDDAGPPIDALAHGRIHEFLAARPVMGPFSLILRAPFTVIANFTARGGESHFYFDDYRLGVLPCMVAAGLLGLWLARLMERRGASVFACAVPVVVCVVNPVSLRAVHFGHPEEVLGAALLAGSAVAAVERKPWTTAILLGLAITNKQWALIGAPVVLTLAVLAHDRERLRKPAIALGAIALALVVPFLIVDASSLWHLTRALIDIRNSPVWPANVWYTFMPSLNGEEAQRWAPDLRHMPEWLGLFARPLIFTLAVVLPLAYWRRLKEDLVGRGLALLALVMLMRCALDPADNGYYHVPFLLALVTADALTGRFYATAVACVLLQLPTTLSPTAPDLSIYYLCWSVPFMIYLGARAYGVRSRIPAVAR